jgi:hypothetical protein
LGEFIGEPGVDGIARSVGEEACDKNRPLLRGRLDFFAAASIGTVSRLTLAG